MPLNSPHQNDPSWRLTNARIEQLSQRIDQLAEFAENGVGGIQKFIEGLKIINKQGEVASLIMNRSQEVVFHELLEAREQKLPARFICCKSRQLGISTLIEAFIFALITRNPHRFALVVAHSIESAQVIFAMTQRFHRRLALRFTQPLAKNNMRCIEYPPPHDSSIRIDSAANRNLGRGGTLHYVHASEVAFWERPEEPVLAINQAVPLHWDTLVFWESTANGMQNLFYRTWTAAERGESDMEPIFLTWKGFPTYSLPVARTERLEPDADEAKYAEAHGLSDGQIKWARHVRINQCHNSWDKFHQEYPVAADLAFVFTGMPWFDQEFIRDLLDDVAVRPLKTGYLAFTDSTLPLPPSVEGGGFEGLPCSARTGFETLAPGGRSHLQSLSPGGRGKGEGEHIPNRPEPGLNSDNFNSPTVVFVEQPNGPLQIWKLPEPSLSYSLGMDVGEGVGADYTVIQVICHETGEVVARYRSYRVRAETAGAEAYLLGSYYNFGLLGIERNGPGLAALAVCERGMAEYPQMTGYPNLYYHTYTDRKIPEETHRLGWITNKTTKEAMLSRLALTVASRGLVIFSRTTLFEMQGFVWDAEKKTFRQNYKAPDSRLAHDDEIMALAIANEMRTHTWENRFITTKLPSGEF
jgi:hypothetical protein